MIKKLLTLAMSLTMVLTMASITAFATESTDNVGVTPRCGFEKPVDYPSTGLNLD